MNRITILLILICLIINISPVYAAGDPYPVWKAVKRTKIKEVKGKWHEAVRGYTGGHSNARLSVHTTLSVSSSYNGELKISIPYLESYALMQHKINKSFQTKVSYTESLAGKKKGTYAIFYRRIYDTRKVTQRKYYHVDGYLAGTKTKKKVKTKDFRCISYRCKKISDKDIT